MLAHCTSCEESFEFNFRGSTEQLFVAVDGYYQTPSLGDKQYERTQALFSLSYVLKRSEEDAERHKVERDL